MAKFRLATEEMLEEEYLSARREGMVLDGTANDAPALPTATTAAATASRPLLLAGNGRLASAVVLNGTTRIHGAPGAKLSIATSALGIDIKPIGMPFGVVNAISLLGAAATVTGSAWTVNEHAGKWAEIFDSTVNPISGDPTTHARRILSNTADTLTLEWGVGHPVPAGATLTIYTPIDEVDLKDITVDRSLAGSANLAIRYVKSVKLRGVAVNNAGDYSTSSGNALSVYHCDRVQIDDMVIKRAGNFGAFIYNCDNVRVNNPTVTHWGGQFAIQLKDCRDGVVRGANITADGTKGDNGISLKCSGLNPAYDLKGVDCRAVGAKQSGMELSTITNEGAGYSAQNFRYVRCSSHKSQTSGFTVITDATSAPSGLAWDSCSSTESTQYGFSASVAKGLKIINCLARLNRFEGIHVGTSDVEILGGLMQDNVQAYTTGASRSSEIYLDASALRTKIKDVTFRRTAAGKALRAVRELAGATATVIQDCKIREEVAAYSQDYLLSGAGSIAFGNTAVDSFTGTPTINKKAYTTAP